MVKTYILDTNVLLHDPTALFKFEENRVILPIFVLEEIDKFKMEMTERGRSARQVSRTLDELRAQGTLSEGVPLPTQGTLKVHVPPDGKRERTVDQDILKVVAHFNEAIEGPVIFITMDVNLRVRGDALGLKVESYENQSVDLDNVCSSVLTLSVDEDTINRFYKTGWVQVEEEYEPNASVFLDGPHNSAGLGRYMEGKVHKLRYDGKARGPSGIKAKNKEQAFALDLLMDPEISLVTIQGQAGTGKTLLALAAGLQQLEESYDKLLISRPVMPMGKDLGYLPGTIDEKLDPWMKPLFDNLEYLCMASKRKSSEVDHYFEDGIIQVEPLTYIRGRSLPGQFVIVDECFPYDTPVVTEEGPRKIGALFSRWIKGHSLPKVQSFNTELGLFEWKSVPQMWHRGKRNLVDVKASNRKIRCTPDHLFLSDRGWIEAYRLQEGDLLVTSHPEEAQVLMSLTSDQEQVLVGSFLGDGSVECFGPSRIRLSVTHGESQLEYCTWKASLFNAPVKPCLNSGYNPDQPKYGFTTKAYGYRTEMPRPKSTCPPHLAQALDIKGLAIWFMDDGSAYTHRNGCTFHTESFDIPSLYLLIERLEAFGIRAKVHTYEKGSILRVGEESYLQLCQLIAPWVHPSMAYKLHENFKSLAGTGVWETTSPEWGYTAVSSVSNVEGVSEHVFDMEVDDNHNFVIPSTSKGKHGGSGGVVVHNCQNLSPHEVKTIITRAGEGAKIILTGDPHQIDNPYVDATSNGLSVTANRLKGQRITGHITLTKGERSELANVAAELL